MECTSNMSILRETNNGKLPLSASSFLGLLFFGWVIAARWLSRLYRDGFCEYVACEKRYGKISKSWDVNNHRVSLRGERMTRWIFAEVELKTLVSFIRDLWPSSNLTTAGSTCCFLYRHSVRPLMNNLLGSWIWRTTEVHPKKQRLRLPHLSEWSKPNVFTWERLLMNNMYRLSASSFKDPPTWHRVAAVSCCSRHRYLRINQLQQPCIINKCKEASEDLSGKKVDRSNKNRHTQRDEMRKIMKICPPNLNEMSKENLIPALRTKEGMYLASPTNKVFVWIWKRIM